MDQHILAEAISIAELGTIDSFLHDSTFDFSKINYTSESGEVWISFDRTLIDKRLSKSREGSSKIDDTADVRLHISNVTSVRVDDPERLVLHSYAHLLFGVDGRLTLTSQFPGRIEFEVTGLNISVVA